MTEQMLRRTLVIVTAAFVLGTGASSASASTMPHAGVGGFATFGPAISVNAQELLQSMVEESSDPGTGATVSGTTEASKKIVPGTVKVAETSEGEKVSATETLDEVITKVQAYYDSVEDFVADFEQRYTSAALGETRTSSGRVFFKKPGKMRWDYSAPTERFLISNGARLWVYEPSQGQYFTDELGESQLPAALQFLMGDGDLRDAFEISLDEHGSNEATLVLIPKTPSSQYARLKFVVDSGSGAVTETVIYDAVGNRNRLIFTNEKKNQGLPDSGFEFEAPEGAVQVEAPQ